MKIIIFFATLFQCTENYYIHRDTTCVMHKILFIECALTINSIHYGSKEVEYL